MSRVETLGIFAAALSLFTLSSCGMDADLPSTPDQGKAQAAPNAATGITITIAPNSAGKGSSAFGVNPLVVPPGTTVTWINADSVAHTATSTNAIFDSGSIAPGKSFTYNFANQGSFPYYCSIYGATSMSGLIQVGTTPPPSLAGPPLPPPAPVPPPYIPPSSNPKVPAFPKVPGYPKGPFPMSPNPGMPIPPGPPPVWGGTSQPGPGLPGPSQPDSDWPTPPQTSATHSGPSQPDSDWNFPESHHHSSSSHGGDD